MSRNAEEEQAASATRISMVNIGKLGFEVSFEQASALRSWYDNPPVSLDGENMEYFRLLFSIISRFELSGGVDRGQARRIRRRWIARAFRAMGLTSFINPEKAVFFLELCCGKGT